MEDVYHTPIQNIKQSLRRGRTIEEVNNMTETYILQSPNGSLQHIIDLKIQQNDIV